MYAIRSYYGYAEAPAPGLECLPDPYLSGALPIVPGKPVLRNNFV